MPLGRSRGLVSRVTAVTITATKTSRPQPATDRQKERMQTLVEELPENRGPPRGRGPRGRMSSTRSTTRRRPRLEPEDPRLPQGPGADAGANRPCRPRAAVRRRRSRATSAAGSATPPRGLASARSPQPEYGYDVPQSADETFTFTATVAVQPKPSCPTGPSSRCRRLSRRFPRSSSTRRSSRSAPGRGARAGRRPRSA